MDFSDGFPNSGKFRPHDLLTVHVLDASVRQINAVGRGPVSGRPLDCLVVTGDLTNSYCLSELSAAVGVFAGGSVNAHAGGRYVGVQDEGAAPPALFKSIWHPEPAPSPLRRDDWQRLYGYPTVKGFLAAAVEPIAAPGSDFKWYVGIGNHDDAGRPARGTLSPKAQFVDLVRIGDRLPTELPPGVKASEFWTEVRRSDAAQRHALLESLPFRKVPASTLRRAFSTTEFIDAWSHGASRKLLPTRGESSLDKPFYSFSISADVVGIMLNTASPSGGTEAVLDAAQADWLEKELALLSARSYDSKGHLVHSDAEDKLVVLFSHHPATAFGEDSSPSDESSPSLNRSAILDLIARFPNVIAWMNGHTHRHRVASHKARYGYGGFWEITTASLIDYPQQSRIVEVMDNRNGTLSLNATLVDHSTPESVAYEGEHTPASLAALSLELAMNRPGLNFDAVMGTGADQNVELLVRKPY
ncbi:metallophosphoesterase (TIGR03767 family) [Arthrobacter sp. MP_M7]|nr:metallophosphoesterase (TIGR03767 family) [Arthrobacter sp. MP_M7]